MLQLPKEWYNALEWQYPPHQVICMRPVQVGGSCVCASHLDRSYCLTHTVITPVATAPPRQIAAGTDIRSGYMLQRQGSYEEEGRCVNTMKVCCSSSISR